MPDWNVAVIDASCVSGIENWRAYWIIACMSPTEIAPLEICSPPTTAISDELDVAEEDHQRLDHACRELRGEAGLVQLVVVVANRLLDVALAAEVFTIAWPVKTSSVWPLTLPV